MSMIANFKATSDRDIEALLARPERIEKILYGEYATQEKKESLFRLFRKKKKLSPAHWEPEDPGDDFDVDKAWHGIHYLLTGSPLEGTGPEAFILAGGAEIGDIDVGYGPARAFLSAEVKEIAGKLESLDRNLLAGACDAKKFSEYEIYPDIWEEEPENGFSYILDYFEELKRFVCRAAEKGKALIVYIN